LIASYIEDGFWGSEQKMKSPTWQDCKTGDCRQHVEFFYVQSSDLDQSAGIQRGHALAGDVLEDFNRRITCVAQLCDHGAG
jgi:hypothetical protein